jgi:hypothetical protein
MDLVEHDERRALQMVLEPGDGGLSAAVGGSRIGDQPFT